MARQISSEMFLIRGSGESAPRGWRFSKMRAEGGLRGRLGAHTDDFQEKHSANCKDNQWIEWNKLLFLVHWNLQENWFLCAANDFQIRVHWFDPLGMRAFSKQINVVECIQNDKLKASTGDWGVLLARVLAALTTATLGSARLQEPQITLLISIACMWWATFCTKPVKLQHEIGNACQVLDEINGVVYNYHTPIKIH